MDLLVVDPEAEVRLVFFVAADQVGCEVSFAESGAEALALLAAKPDFDLVFAAAELGDMGAIDFASRLRQLAHYGYQPLIFLSASDEADELVALLEYGDDVILKPFSQQVLLAKILAHKRIRGLYKDLQSQNRQLQAYQKRAESELQIAADVFRQLTDRSVQAVPGVSTFASPYGVFSGDIVLMSQGADHNLYFLVADVTGHGLAAALGSMPIAEHFLALAATGMAVGALARELNRIHVARVPPYILCAALIGRFDPATGRVHYWSGGMPPAMVVNAAGDVRPLFRSMHMAIGACEDHQFEASEGELTLQPGDRLVCHTDGVTETCSPAGDYWGSEGLVAALQQGAQSGNLLENVIAQLTAFRGTANAADDDVTLICLDVDAYLAHVRQASAGAAG